MSGVEKLLSFAPDAIAIARFNTACDQNHTLSDATLRAIRIAAIAIARFNTQACHTLHTSMTYHI